jgi:peptide/nickel transport system permease protein
MADTERNIGSPETERALPLDETEATDVVATAEPVAPGTPQLGAPPAGLSKTRRGKRGKKKKGIAFWLALGWLVLVLFLAITASWLPIADPVLPQRDADGRLLRLAAPGEDGQLLGTDGTGRDVLSRLIHGSRVSLIVGFVTVAIGMTIGGTLGLMVGYFRGWFEKTVMAIVDVVLAFPGLVLLLGLLAFVGQSLSVISITIGMLAVPRYTRVARANTLAIAQREFVLAAQAMGAKSGRILFRELLPNVLLPVAAFGLVAIALVIVLEGSLAFLGLSVELPTPTWGSMIAEGKRCLTTKPLIAAIPSTVMFLTVLALNFVGDSLRSIFDVRESGL